MRTNRRTVRSSTRIFLEELMEEEVPGVEETLEEEQLVDHRFDEEAVKESELENLSPPRIIDAEETVTKALSALVKMN